MKLPVFAHQFNTAYSPQPPLGVTTNDTELPISDVYVKTNDGVVWMARWDTHNAAIASVEALTSAVRIYEAQGIGTRPWGVVSGLAPEEEGRLAATVARAAGGAYIVDLEPYYHGGPGNPQYWRSDLGAGPAAVDEFARSFLANGGTELWLSVDARDPHLDPVSFSQWTLPWHKVMRCLPQVYFTDFSTSPEFALDKAVTTLADHGWTNRASIYPVLPADAEPEEMMQAIRYAHALGCGGVSLWQRATLRSDTMADVAELADPWTPTPPIEPGKSTVVLAALERAQNHLDAAQADILEARAAA